ncbi:MAG: helix-turn-helix domain-containing protein [Butyricicoccus sp.]
MDIKVKRKEKNLSQSELAQMIGVNQTAVSQWERGATMPTLDKAAMIANALGCTIDELYGRSESDSCEENESPE